MGKLTPVDEDLTASPVELVERAHADRMQQKQVEAERAEDVAILRGLRR